MPTIRLEMRHGAGTPVAVCRRVEPCCKETRHDRNSPRKTGVLGGHTKKNLRASSPEVHCTPRSAASFYSVMLPQAT